MLINKKSLFYFVIFLTFICISHEKPTDTENDNHEEVNESDIEKVIAEKEEQEKAEKENLDNKNQEIQNKNNDKNVSQQIKALEKEKGKLYKQINKAIEESVLLLEHVNDTEAKLGIDFMKDLKDQLKLINGTDIILENKEESIQRRSQSGDSRKHAKKKVYITYEEISDLFKGNGFNSSSSKKIQHVNDVDMQKRIDDWILQRQLEKKKIQDYKIKSRHGKNEKCPRIGLGKKKIKVDGLKRKIYMPCCRKCCKKSYMGCL